MHVGSTQRPSPAAALCSGSVKCQLGRTALAGKQCNAAAGTRADPTPCELRCQNDGDGGGRYYAAIAPREQTTIDMVLPGQVLFLRPLKVRPAVCACSSGICGHQHCALLAAAELHKPPRPWSDRSACCLTCGLQDRTWAAIRLMGIRLTLGSARCHLFRLSANA